MSNYARLLGVAVVICAFAVGVPLGAAGQGRGRGQAKKVEKAEKVEKHENKAEKKADKNDDRSRVVVVDRDGHVRVIREYARAGSLPPGLAKRESLPPGLREQLRERGALPPGLQKRLVPVPAPLVVRLPAVPSYYHRYFIGDDLIVVDTRTNRLVAVIRDVW
jgi:hypothetical protein